MYIQKIERLGEKRINKQGIEMEITRYINNRTIEVTFSDGCIRFPVSYKNFLEGSVNSYFARTVYGIGFLGGDIYRTTDDNHKLNNCYSTWIRMLQRAYDANYHKKNPTYKDCFVEEEWHNFQNFAKWYEKNHYQIQDETMQLDKDILIKGNKKYSRDTCVFVPQRINKIITKAENKRGDLPIGVVFNKTEHKYRAQCSNLDKNICIGRFKSPEKAFNAYKSFKESLIKEVAEKYSSLIPQKLYETLIKYEVCIND